MRLSPELAQMLRDARVARRGLRLASRVWNAIAEHANIAAMMTLARFGMDHSARPHPPLPVSAPVHHRGSLMLFEDLRHALLRLRSRPGSAVTCALMLALAIGVSAAMFTVADHLLIRPAPFRDASRLVRVSTGRPADRFGNVSLTRDLAIALRGNSAFIDVQGIAQDSIIVEGADGLTAESGARVTPGTVEMLGVAPILGRTFAPGEGRAGSDDRVMISETLWRRDFGADPGIIGRVVRISNAPMTVIGVMPATFAFPYWTTRVWRPIDLEAPAPDVSKAPIEIFARLAPALRLADAAAVATPTALAVSALTLKPGQQIILHGVADGFADPYSRTAVIALSGGVALVFLVLSANVANLVLARTMARYTEYSIASAIGASRARILRQAFLENAAIGLTASAIGFAIGWALVAAAVAYLPASITDRTLSPIAIDLRAAMAASALGLLATLIAGLPPAWIGTKVNAADSLRAGSRGSTESKLSRRWTRAMLVAEVALASMLLVGAGLLATSFLRMTQAESGLDLENVTTAWVSLPSFRFPDRDSRAAAAQSLRERMSALPGVTAVAISRGLPPGGGSFRSGTIDADTGASMVDTVVFAQSAGTDFFSVYGVQLLEGRHFQPGDTADDVIISSGLAAKLWPGASALGHSFRYRDDTSVKRVIGIAREVRSPLRAPTDDAPEYYTQMTAPSSQVMFGMRCAAACPSEAAIRSAIRATDPGMIPYQVGALDERYLAQFERPRAAATLALSFAAVGVAAAAGGLFSVLTFAVGRRRREFGVRVALGARPGQMKTLVIGEGLMIAGLGLAIGSLGAWVLSRWLSSLAYGVSLASPIVWLSVAGTIVTATLAACWRPASVAASADPSVLLRDN
jgi:predicted permease